MKNDITLVTYENWLDFTMEQNVHRYITAKNLIPIRETLDKAIPFIIISLSLILIIGIAILWNQRKIKKMLRQIQEQNVSSDEAKAHKESEKQ